MSFQPAIKIDFVHSISPQIQFVLLRLFLTDYSPLTDIQLRPFIVGDTISIDILKLGKPRPIEEQRT
jgi:hypothetical protein